MAEVFLDEVLGGSGGGIADDDDEHVVGLVAFAVVLEGGVAVDGVEAVEVSDDGFAEGVFAVDGVEHQLAEGASGIIFSHVDFPADDVFFFSEFGVGEGGAGGEVGEDVEGGVEAFAEGIDPVDGAVEGGVGVEVAAAVLDGFGEFAGAAVAGALEDHVFDEVGDAGAAEGAFVDAAGADPGLDADEGGVVVFFDEEF